MVRPLPGGGENEVSSIEVEKAQLMYGVLATFYDVVLLISNCQRLL